jgi:hypothetical protein
MAGFVVLVAPDLPQQLLEEQFDTLLQRTARYKQLAIQPSIAKGVHCMVAKLDSIATIHPGIVRDNQSGSWLLAAGTIVALEGDNHPTALLTRLLREYIECGPQALEAYDGQFALVIYNGRAGSLSVISDAISMFGIYYTQRGNQLLVSSSALAIASQIQSKPDVLAIEHFLRTGRLDGDKTLWQEVKRLLGGMVLRATGRQIEKTEYWSPNYDGSVAHLSLDEAVEQGVDLLTHSFSRLLTREGKTWVDLTGGFDSRLAAMMVAKINLPFSVYCVGPEGHPDVQISKTIANTMGWEHVHTQLPDPWGPELYAWFDTALTAGDGRSSALRLAFVLRGFMERNVSVKTNVMGVGGENFRGYRWQIEGLNIGRTHKVNYDAWLDNIFPSIPIQVMKHDRTKQVKQELYDFISNLCRRYATLPNTVQIDRFEFGRDSGLGGAYLSSIVCIGRSLMPFFFKELVNFSFSLNYKWKYPQHNLFARTMFEHQNKLLSTIDTTTGGPAYPIRVSNLYRFRPLWKKMTHRAVAITSRKIVGKSLQVLAEQEHPAYPLPSWQAAFRRYADLKSMLDYEQMYTAGLYDQEELTNLITHAEQEPDKFGEFLDEVITVEMAMRTVGTSIE